MWSAFFKKIAMDLIKDAVFSLINWARRQYAGMQKDKIADNEGNAVQKIADEIKVLRDQPMSKERDEKIKELEVKLRSALKRQHSGIV
jgi:hypothetical protein